jgi:transglutaminase-like putative cysteine protease
MEHLVLPLARRYLLRIGWPQALLALAAALCPAFASASSPLNLPFDPFFWAGLLGLLVGMSSTRSPTTDRPFDPSASLRAGFAVPEPVEGQDRRPPTADHRLPTAEQRGGEGERGRGGDDNHVSRITFHASRFTHHVSRITFHVFWIVIVIVVGCIFVVAADQALPPFGLLFQDVAAVVEWAGAVVRRLPAEAPMSRSAAFLAESLPRVWRDLLAAPEAGERGARLMVAAGGAALTWVGAFLLGRALVKRRVLYGWGLPLLAALVLTSIVGGGDGVMLMAGMALLLLLTITSAFGRREAAWERARIDFSDELRLDVLMWGAGIVMTLLLVAWLLPTTVGSPLADLLWREVEVPSGLAVLERNIQRPRPPPRVEVGISELPALQLGMSLETDPPEQVTLRVRLDAPLPPSSIPRYWRARVFNIYNGRVWTTDARVSPIDAIAPVAGVVPGAIIQDIEDVRADRELLIALPDIIALSVDANGERLADGTLAALTERGPVTRYQALSRPQEQAEPPQQDEPPPDLRGYLALPPLPPRVGEYARAIVGDGKSQHDQALALESALRELPYTYQVQPLPSGGDAVDQFLFEMRHGYCTYYASAMAVLARSLGIPARIASGYFTGAYDEASGVYVVRESDAHAWPELYVDGHWLPFEPTPIRPLPARAQTGELPIVPVPAPAEQPEQNENGPLIWLAVLVIVVLLSAVGIWWGRRPGPAPLAAQVQLLLERNGARAGVPWPPGTTLHEYGALLEPYLDGEAGALREVVELVALARYGPRALDSAEQGRLRAAAERVWARLDRRPRSPGAR